MIDLTTDDTNTRTRQSKTCKIHWFSLDFKHIATSEAITKHTTTNGTGATSTSRRFTSEIRRFFSWEIKVFQGFRATAPQTYDRFRTSNGAADVLYVLLKSLTPPQTYNIFSSKGEIEMWRKFTRWIHGRKLSRRLKPPQTNDTCLHGQSFSSQTCDKKKWISRGEFFITTKLLK